MIDFFKIKAISFDLDDTLWPVWPTIGRAEEALAQWLTQARTQARAVPVEAKLQRAPLPSEGAPSPAATTSTTSTTPTKSPAWSGSVVLSLPAS